MNRRLSTLAIAGAVGILGLGGASAASALSGTSSSSDSLVDRLVEKFNLNKTEVQAVFDEEQKARTAERTAEQSERLQDAVDDGDITAEQKTKIEAKLKELQAARETERTALEKWATDNKIDTQYLMGRGHGGNDDRLSDAVADGDLTEAQRTLIEDKQDELEEARDKQRDELDQWAEDNDIDTQYLMGGMKGGRGPGGNR